jgi:hypothetical protein
MVYWLAGLVFLLVAGGAWLGWRALHPEQPRSNVTIHTPGKAIQSCNKVTEILRDLPLTEDGIAAATAQIHEETIRLKACAEAISRDEWEWASLSAAHYKLQDVRKELPRKLEPFTKRVVVKGYAPESSGSVSLKQLEAAATEQQTTCESPGQGRCCLPR